MSVLAQVFEILGSLGIFFYGMKIMSEAIQRLTGKRLRASLNFMTRNRFGGIFTGFFITSVIQSSSATTVMVVSFVNAGLLTLIESIGVIMGANLGTTVTFWMVSFVGFKFKISAIALPVIALGLPLIFSKRSKWSNTGEMMIGFALLFLGLSMLKHAVPDIKNSPEMLEFLSGYTEMGFGSILLFICVGIVLTIVVQSSSAAGAITITMAFKGWIDFPIAAAIILGENIGTTVTANLAALPANTHAKRAARAHFLFNALGVIWMLIVFVPFLNLVDSIVPGDPSIPQHIPLHLSGFHTLFNLINICILVGFAPKIAKLVEKWLPLKESDMAKEYKLEYISTQVTTTPEIAILESKKEITKMAELVSDMYETSLKFFKQPAKNMEKEVANQKTQEELSDQMEEQITNYLIECSKEVLDEESAQKVTYRLRIVDELETIGDYCYKLIKLIQKKHEKKMEFDPSSKEEMEQFTQLVSKFIAFNLKHLKNNGFSKQDLEEAFEIERGIDSLRDTLKASSLDRLKGGGDLKAELLFMDILKNCEKIGDHSLNVAQAMEHMTVLPN